MRVEAEGGEFERLCGAYARQHYNAAHEKVMVNGRAIAGQFTEYALTSAEPFLRFEDGRVAAFRRQSGTGDVQVFAFGVTEGCFKPGNAAYEEWLAAAVMDGATPAWTCRGAVAFRRRAGKVDHWFLVNDGPAESEAAPVSADAKYRRVTDVMADRDLPADNSLRVRIPAGLGCWLRCEA